KRMRDKIRELYLIVIKFLAAAIEGFRVNVWPVLREKTEALIVFLQPRWKRYTFLAVMTVTLLVGTYTAYVFISYLFDRGEIITDLEQQKEWLYGRGESERRPPIEIYDVNDRLIGQYLPIRGSHMTMRTCEAMTWLSQTTVASEDREFYEHGAISVRGIARAMLNNLLRFRFSEGGGTITQQLARNLYTDRSRTLYRKLYETFVAFLIEDHLTKDEILCLYMNKIYMGEGRIGAEEASWFYFRKPPEQLDAAEAAMIVGLYPSPVAYSPLNNIDLSLRKQELVLDGLVKAELLTEADRNLALQRFLKRYDVHVSADGSDAGEIGKYGASRDFALNLAPTANERVKELLYDMLPEDEIRKGGLKIYTTIDYYRQRAALASVRSAVEGLRTEMQKQTDKVDADTLARLARRINGVIVSLDAYTGDIRAVVGGVRVTEGNMTHRVWRMRRQPGSTIKGFLYAVAMYEDVVDINSIVDDTRPNYNGYSPRNWDGVYLGPIPLRKALAHSINSVAVHTLYEVGIRTFRRKIIEALPQDASATDELDWENRLPTNLSLALGSAELTPLELARLYAVLGNQGRFVYPRLITRIEDASGDLLCCAKEDTGDTILSDEAANKAVALMTYVFDDNEGGTAAFIGNRRKRDAGYLPFDVAGKTGTVQMVSSVRRKFHNLYGYHDAWFVGMVPGEVTVVWLGHDEGAPISGGGTRAATVWAAYAQSALRGKVDGEFVHYDIEDEEKEDSWFDFFDEDSDNSDANEIDNTDSNPTMDEPLPTDTNANDPDDEPVMDSDSSDENAD
ncbi:MAG: transglycosylase domain-containing protein, partial [Leptospiraceae bacterium]|nr:transglycosylase domain-containing protein [Leptospiraceae bacterium]